MTDAEKIEKLETAIKLVWRLAVKNEIHLGYERRSGVAKGCIPCSCAAALERGMDHVDTDELKAVLETVTPQ